MERRTFFGSLVAGLTAWIGRGPTPVAGSVADPLLPYCEFANKDQWLFLRQSEVDWLETVIPQVNAVAQDRRQVILRRVAPDERVAHPVTRTFQILPDEVAETFEATHAHA